MNIVFMGTPRFAAVCLEKIARFHNVAAVFSQPDKPVGRKHILTPPEVKVTAEKLGIPVFQPERLKDGEAEKIIRGLAPDAIVVAAYGKILPKGILSAPKYGCINVHGSLLPKYRGAAPIQWAVINGEKETGITTMLMNEGLDCGDILLKKSIPIGENETSGELFERLSVIGAELLIQTLEKIENNTVIAQKQNESEATFAPMLNKGMSPVDFSKPADEVRSLINGLSPWPAATAVISGETVKIYRSQTEELCGSAGSLLDGTKLIIACSDRSVRLLEVQPAGSKKMTDEEFMRGHKIQVGTKLG